MELSEYIKQGEPSKAEKSVAWQAAIGLQDVDGLKVSDYLLETAKEHIEGNIDIQAAQRRIESYYKASEVRNRTERGTQEADIVASRIAEILGEKTFQFSPVELQNIHKRLFAGVFSHAGQLRDYNITKKEWVLKGETVAYADYGSIWDTLKYDFSEEKNFSYEGIGVAGSIKHIAKFIAGVWQIHPFGEGNTRATAVFIIKYLQTFGFKADNTVFANNSWYFRNALVRANYSDIQNDVFEDTSYLEAFFENLLLGKKNDLKNRYLHLDFFKDNSDQTMVPKRQNTVLKRQNDALECDLAELALLKLLKGNPTVTQNELVDIINKPRRTLQRMMLDLQQKGYLKREGGKRYGQWIVLVEIQ